MFYGYFCPLGVISYGCKAKVKVLEEVIVGRCQRAQSGNRISSLRGYQDWINYEKTS